MATNKSKKSNKSNKSKKDESTKSKSVTTSTEKTEIETKDTKTIKITAKNGKLFAGFFAKKYEGTESILTVFKNPKFYGSLLGEILGTMLLALLIFSVFLMGLPNIATYAFALIAIIIAVYAFSGSCLNPIITIGMMATRRISVIRGVMYIVAEVIGAWLAWLIFNGFHLAGGETAYDIPSISELAEGTFWPMALIEILGACMIGFLFARALKYKRSVLTFGAIVAGSITLAYVVGYVASAAFLGGSNNFVMNPSIALMLQIFPSSGADFGEILGGIMQALSLYAILPMLAGACGFYLADFTSHLSSEE